MKCFNEECQQECETGFDCVHENECSGFIPESELAASVPVDPPSAGSVSDFQDLLSDIEEIRDPLADPECCSCEGRGFYPVLDVGEYDEQQTTVQCACKRKQNGRVERHLSKGD